MSAIVEGATANIVNEQTLAQVRAFFTKIINY